MKTNDLYALYDIMPQLITHQLRVAYVGKIVAENWQHTCDPEFITQLCLVHDLGNIVKFDLTDGVDRTLFGEIDNLAHWQEIQKKYWSLYGKNAHDATIGILHDSGLTRFIHPIEEEEKLYFSEPDAQTLLSTDPSVVILMYADCRVTPAGITSYRTRIDDLRARYGGGISPTWHDWTYFFDDWMQKQVTTNLGAVTEESARPIFDQLLTYPL